MSNQPPNPPTPPSGDDAGQSWPASPPTVGDQPPTQPPSQPPTQPPSQPPSQPPAQPPAPPTQAGDDAGFGGQSMPPPPPDDGGGGMVPTGPYSATNAIAYGWNKFVANLGPIVAAEILLFIGLVLVVFVLALVTGVADTMTPEGSPGIMGALFNLVVAFLSLLVTAAIVRAALAIVDGRKLDFSEFFRTEQMGQVVVAAILLALANAIVSFLPIIGAFIGLAISVFGAFILFFILDANEEAIPAIMASVNFVAANLGQVLLLILLSIVVIFVGLLVCGVGLLAAWPVVVIAQAYTFRRLRDLPVTA